MSQIVPLKWNEYRMLSRVSADGKTLFLYKKIIAKDFDQAEKMFYKVADLRYDDVILISIREKRVPTFYYMSYLLTSSFLAIICCFCVYSLYFHHLHLNLPSR